MRTRMEQMAVRAIALGMLAVAAGCGGEGSEPLRRIEALEARVQRLEQATLPGAGDVEAPAATGRDSVP